MGKISGGTAGRLLNIYVAPVAVILLLAGWRDRSAEIAVFEHYSTTGSSRESSSLVFSVEGNERILLNFPLKGRQDEEGGRNFQ